MGAEDGPPAASVDLLEQLVPPIRAVDDRRRLRGEAGLGRRDERRRRSPAVANQLVSRGGRARRFDRHRDTFRRIIL